MQRMALALLLYFGGIISVVVGVKITLPGIGQVDVTPVEEACIPLTVDFVGKYTTPDTSCYQSKTWTTYVKGFVGTPLFPQIISTTNGEDCVAKARQLTSEPDRVSAAAMCSYVSHLATVCACDRLSCTTDEVNKVVPSRLSSCNAFPQKICLASHTPVNTACDSAVKSKFIIKEFKYDITKVPHKCDRNSCRARINDNRVTVPGLGVYNIAPEDNSCKPLTIDFGDVWNNENRNTSFVSCYQPKTWKKCLKGFVGNGVVYTALTSSKNYDECIANAEKAMGTRNPRALSNARNWCRHIAHLADKCDCQRLTCTNDIVNHRIGSKSPNLPTVCNKFSQKMCRSFQKDTVEEECAAALNVKPPELTYLDILTWDKSKVARTCDRDQCTARNSIADLGDYKIEAGDEDCTPLLNDFGDAWRNKNNNASFVGCYDTKTWNECKKGVQGTAPAAVALIASTSKADCETKANALTPDDVKKTTLAWCAYIADLTDKCECERLACTNDIVNHGIGFKSLKLPTVCNNFSQKMCRSFKKKYEDECAAALNVNPPALPAGASWDASKVTKTCLSTECRARYVIAKESPNETPKANSAYFGMGTIGVFWAALVSCLISILQ